MPWSSEASDLALDAAGAEQIFATAQRERSRREQAAIVDRADRRLAGRSLPGGADRARGHGAALTVSGDDRYVADYLYHESLVHLPEDVQRFLRRTAVLDQLSGPLCDALLGRNGRPGDAARPRGIERVPDPARPPA